jgi:hypothetical protein
MSSSVNVIGRNIAQPFTVTPEFWWLVHDASKILLPYGIMGQIMVKGAQVENTLSLSSISGYLLEFQTCFEIYF